jgi:hypothetical protein
VACDATPILTVESSLIEWGSKALCQTRYRGVKQGNTKKEKGWAWGWQVTPRYREGVVDQRMVPHVLFSCAADRFEPRGRVVEELSGSEGVE